MIATQLDAAYAPWLDLFLTSLQLTNPTAPVYVELVNFPVLLSEYFRSSFPTADIVDVALGEPSRRALAHRKVDTALSCLTRHPRASWYFVCDVDLLFRRPLDPLLTALTDRDAGVVFRDGVWEGQHYDHLRVACGFVAFKDARLLDAWKEEMAQPMCLGYEPSSWFYDQVTLYQATRRLPIDYLAIDERAYINREFDEHAVVWSANMDPKELMYLRFRKELDSLRRLFTRH